MNESQKKLETLLAQPGLRQSLAQAFSKNLDDDEHVDDLDLFRLPDKTRCGIREVIQLEVIDKLPKPVPITAEELSEFVIAQLVGIPVAEFMSDMAANAAFHRFQNIALIAIERENISHVFSIGEDWMISDANAVECVDWPFELWSSESGFQLLASVRPPSYGYVEVHASLHGKCTARAFAHAETELTSVLPSIVRTVQLSATSADYAKLVSAEEQRWIGTPVEFMFVGAGLRVLTASLHAYFGDPIIHDEVFIKRIRNAIELLKHADQLDAPLAIAVTFAALEALVCEKRKDTTEQITEHIPTLLVRDTAKRKSRSRLLGKLYQIRCDVMHGDEVHGDLQKFEVVRRIAAGVLRAVLEWQDGVIKSGHADKATFKELMDEVFAAKRKPAEVVNTPDLSELIPESMQR
jgi:hypothetical protein